MRQLVAATFIGLPVVDHDGEIVGFVTDTTCSVRSLPPSTRASSGLLVRMPVPISRARSTCCRRRDLRHRSRSYWEERADRIGPEVGAYVREVFAADDVLSQLRTVQQIVCHLERFSVARARAACERARFYASYG